MDFATMDKEDVDITVEESIGGVLKYTDLIGSAKLR